VATTNRSLAGMVREGLFRADFVLRLNVIALTLPPFGAEEEYSAAGGTLLNATRRDGGAAAGVFREALRAIAGRECTGAGDSDPDGAVGALAREEITAELQPGLFEAASLAKGEARGRANRWVAVWSAAPRSLAPGMKIHVYG